VVGYASCKPADALVLVLFAFVVLDLVYSVPSQEIGYEERLRDDLFCVVWDVNLNSDTLDWMMSKYLGGP